MRIMIHSNSPQSPSGYGVQVKLLGRLLLRAGHQVAVSAFSGSATGSVVEWEGMTILPAGQINFGVDTIIPHAAHYGADLVITLMDFWQLGNIAEQLQELNLAAWLPIDTTPMGYMDRGTLQYSRAWPLAMSRFGLQQLVEAGHGGAVYLPHAVDTQVFRPMEKRDDFRRGMGIDGRFVVGMVAANNDQIRKGFPEQFEAFRRFHKKHPDALLFVHTIPESGRGLNLRRMASQMGLQDGSYRFSDTYAQIAGIFDEQMMTDLYNVMDVLAECSYAEGFGTPMLEAQACGTPVISTAGSAMDEMRGNGWRVASQPFWNHLHGAWWQRPDIGSIVRAMERAYTYAATKREQARAFALNYDHETVFARHWVPFLETVEKRLAERPPQLDPAAQPLVELSQ